MSMELLKQWQDLAGAIVGGVFGLFIALLVAYQTKRTEERVAATLLITDLLRVAAMVDAATEATSTSSEASDEERAFRIAELLCRFRVKLSPLFDASIARVTHCDIYLAATLALASSMMRDTEPVLLRLEKDIEVLQADKDPERTKKVILADVNTISDAFAKAGPLCRYAVKLLEQLVLGSMPTFHKIRRWIHPYDWEKALVIALRSGNFESQDLKGSASIAKPSKPPS